MKTIKVSDEVWQEIAKRGKFGETENDVLSRVFDVGSHGPEESDGRSKSNFAKDKMHTKVYEDGRKAYLKVHFQGSGREQDFDLPIDRSDKRAIRTALIDALNFGRSHGASKGQMLAIRKALTSVGYHLMK